jgi:hypothetical protein
MCSNDSKEIFKKQITVAIDTVEKNFIEIMSKSWMNLHEKVVHGFPLVAEVIDSLLMKKMISQQQVDYTLKYLKGEIVSSYEI